MTKSASIGNFSGISKATRAIIAKIIPVLIASNPNPKYQKALGVHSKFGGFTDTVIQAVGNERGQAFDVVDRQDVYALLDDMCEKKEIGKQPVRGGFMYYTAENAKKIKAKSAKASADTRAKKAQDLLASL